MADAAAGERPVTDGGGGAVLVVAPNWLGDAVMALPFWRALSRARPGRRVAILAGRGPGAIFRAAGAEVVLRGGNLFADARAARAARADETWLLPNSFRAALIVSLAGIRERIGYGTDGRGFLLTDPVSRPSPTRHQLRDYDALLASRGIEPDLAPPRLEVPAGAQARADEALARAGLSAGEQPLALLAPGAAFAWTKRWPPARWGAMAALLTSRGIRVGFVIGPGEEPIAAEALAAAGMSLPVLGADLDPVELSGLLKRAGAVAANDSGPMHLAAAVGTPVVALFGPTDPGRTGATGSPSRVLDVYVFCSPCYLKECPYRHECMTGIAPADVARAVEDLLETGTTTLPARG